MEWGGVGVVAASADPSVADGQFWPSPAPGTCTSGVTPGRGGGQGCLRLGQFPSRRPWLGSVFFMVAECCV